MSDNLHIAYANAQLRHKKQKSQGFHSDAKHAEREMIRISNLHKIKTGKHINPHAEAIVAHHEKAKEIKRQYVKHSTDLIHAKKAGDKERMERAAKGKAQAEKDHLTHTGEPVEEKSVEYKPAIKEGRKMKTFKEMYEACCAACEKREESMEESDSGLAAKAEKSGEDVETLRKVYKRGVAAWNSGHRPGTTPQQWGMARVNSYITKGKGTYHGADKDLREEVEQTDEQAPVAPTLDRKYLKGTPEHKAYKASKVRQKYRLAYKNGKISVKEEIELEEVAKDKESGLPKKYVSGLSPSTAKARAAHWDKMDKLSDKDPAAYEPAPGDATAKTKESKHTKKYREMFGEACWTGYKKVGMKKKGDKMVPNCVPEEVKQVDEARSVTYNLYRDHKDFDKAHADIDLAVKQAADNPKAVTKAMNKHKKVGATDTEARDTIYLKVKRLHGSAVARKAFNEEVTLDEMSKLSDALAKIKHDFENPPSDHKDAKPAPAKKPEPKKGGGMDYYPDSHGGRRYMGDSVEMNGETIKEASPKAGKNVVPPHVGALATGGVVKEEGKDPLVSSWNKSLVKRIQGSKHPEHVKTNLLAKAKKSKSASDAELVHQELDNMHEESEGENKPLGKVMRAGDGKKKFKVYVKNAKGNTVKVGFGDPNMEIKRDDPERRKNFRARHNCATAKDRTTPRYWSCRQWRSSAKVEA
jgi:hypothetical protein